MKRNQVKDAHDLYDVRAKTYDASFHKRFSSQIVQLANPQPGESVLDLACGTGLVTFSTSKLVGKSGYVTGIDVSTGMLAEARAELQAHPFGNVQLVHHSVTDLGLLHELEGRLFDVITCASALVLLPQPEAALSQWMKYLRPCSRLIIDATHPRALLPGMVLERVGRRLDPPVPSYRDAFKQPKYLATMMQAAGMTRTTLTRMPQLSSRGGSHDLQAFVLNDDDEPPTSSTYTIDDARLVFDAQVNGRFGACMAKEPSRCQAWKLVVNEFTELADDEGIINKVDEVFVGIGSAPKVY